MGSSKDAEIKREELLKINYTMNLRWWHGLSYRPLTTNYILWRIVDRSTVEWICLRRMRVGKEVEPDVIQTLK